MRHLTITLASLLLVSCGEGSEATPPPATGAPAPAPAPTPAPTPTPTPPPSGGAADWYRPKAGLDWHWQLTGSLDTSLPVAVYDIDLYETPTPTIEALQARGVKVICYFSAGSRENYRSDAGDFASADIGKTMDGWPDEQWVDIRSNAVRAIMSKRLDLAAQKGCDGVEPDNVDAYANDSGFALTGADQLSYNRFLAAEAHARGLAVGLKNDLDQVAELVDEFDFAVNEQCTEYDECRVLAPFIAQDKPVFHAEYDRRFRTDAAAFADMCAASKELGFSTLVLPLSLDGSFRKPCPE